MFYTSLKFAMQHLQNADLDRHLSSTEGWKKWRYRLGSSWLVFYCGRVEEKWIFATPWGVPCGSGAGTSARDKHKAMFTAASFAAPHVDDA
jgi:hypothetical protein